ncbi:MAG: hypothetical protein J07HB67_01746 [halophilic archaeon J07HB67]|jgi:hypothetical protein|nr:MAG: hypothetical protein J07HB67_01746 [halophilic archaeon J07HB67]
MSAQSLETGVASVCRATGCRNQEPLVAATVLLTVVLLATGVTLVRLRNAREAVAAERRRAVAEREAFTQFRQRVARLEASPLSTDDLPGRLPTTTGNAAGETTPDTRGAVGTPGRRDADGLRTVQTAYEETVLSTPHYETEYDETVTENMAAEFSTAVAATVADGSALTPALRATLLRGAADAADRRAEVVSCLDAEKHRLQATTDVLDSAATAAAVRTNDAAVSDCIAAAERLDWHESAVTQLTADRQQEVHSRRSDHPHWFDYIYGGLEVTHPVLATAAETLAAIDDARDRLARTVADGSPHTDEPR